VALIPILSDARGIQIVVKKWARKGRLPDAIVIEHPRYAGGHLGAAKIDDLADPRFDFERVLPETLAFFRAEGIDASKVPLIPAGGINTHERVRELIAQGASAVQIGTAFAVTEESDADLAFKRVLAGAKPDDIGAGYTALHAAVLRSDLTLVNALIAHRANPNIRMTKGTWKRRDGEDFTLPATLIGSTPYLLAAKFLEPQILLALKAGGADASLAMPNGATPLMLAAGMNSTSNASRRGVRVVDFGKVEPESQALETVKAVLSVGGDVNAATVAGDTALHGAAAMGYNTVIQLLVDRGAQLNAKNKRGLTPLGALLGGGRGGRGRGAAAVDAGDNPAVGPSSGTIALLRQLGAIE